MTRRVKKKKSLFHRVKKLLFEDSRKGRKPKAAPRERKIIVRRPRTIRRIVRGRVASPPRRRVKKGELARYEENPIIAPLEQHEWEAWQTFNPGAILLEDRVHFLYRAIGRDCISRFGYAASQDGFHIQERLPYPVYEQNIKQAVFNYYSFASGGSFGGAEDPRIVRVNGEDTLYMTYTACDQCLGVALTSIKLNDFLNKKWQWRAPCLISKPGETHKNWVLFPDKIRGKYAILHSINPKILVSYRDSLQFKKGEYIESLYEGACRKNCWDTYVRGAGAPPIKTKEGWLLFYHAIDESDPGKYKVGALLLDLDDPTKILCRSSEPILEPEEEYAGNGFKPQVVYVSGALVKGGELFVYYGCADSYVSVAHANLEKFIKTFIQRGTPKLRGKRLR